MRKKCINPLIEPVFGGRLFALNVRISLYLIMNYDVPILECKLYIFIEWSKRNVILINHWIWPKEITLNRLNIHDLRCHSKNSLLFINASFPSLILANLILDLWSIWVGLSPATIIIIKTWIWLISLLQLVHSKTYKYGRNEHLGILVDCDCSFGSFELWSCFEGKWRHKPTPSKSKLIISWKYSKFNSNFHSYPVYL